jgi:hypothetical protein
VPSQKTRRLGHCCRIYKNAAGKVIAIDGIEVTANELRVGEIFRFSVDKVNIHRTNLHLVAGGSRTVTTIQMVGSYTSLEENGGDFLVLRWDVGETDPEEVVLSLEGKVAVIGDTI